MPLILLKESVNSLTMDMYIEIAYTLLKHLDRRVEHSSLSLDFIDSWFINLWNFSTTKILIKGNFAHNPINNYELKMRIKHKVI